MTDWCGWPRIHGPHWNNGRACAGMLPPDTPDWQTWAKQVAVDAASDKARKDIPANVTCDACPCREDGTCACACYGCKFHCGACHCPGCPREGR